MKAQEVAIPEQAVPALHVQKILVPIDFSTPCNKAFKYALGFARQFGSHIVMIHVIEPAPVEVWRHSQVKVRHGLKTSRL